MKMQQISLILCISLLIPGCASMSVNYDYDQQVNFASLKTYEWMPVPQKTKGSELTMKHVKLAVDNQLEARGLKMSRETPDFLIAAHITKEKKVDTQEWGYVYGNREFFHERPFFRGPQFGESQFDYQYRSGTDTYTYEVGTLILDFVDAKTKELIWRGIATAEIDPSAPSIDIINKAVGKILENFPPAQKR